MKHEAHAVDGGPVGGLLVASADERRGGERGRLGNANELQRQIAIGQLAGGVDGVLLRGQSSSPGSRSPGPPPR